MLLYNLYEFMHATLAPVKFSAIATRMALQHPYNPASYTRGGRTMAAMAELVERATKRFGKPVFGLNTTQIDGRTVNVTEYIVDETPFCNLIRFHRSCKRKDPKVLVVAPLSGHYATLLRGTVEALLPHHDVYITDWMDARQVPLTDGRFDLDTCIENIMDFIRFLGPDVHVVAVCQPAVPVLAAVSVMAAKDDPKQPASMTLMGGPIDPRVSKTQVTKLAEERSLEWFESSVITTVPAYYPGAMRKVYPGFIQLSGFMSMNLDRHLDSHFDFYNQLVTGDGESAEKHRVFYDEYLAVMDLTAEFYLQTVETVFQKHSLPKEEMIYTDTKTGEKIRILPSRIKKTALLTIEGELDDISATGQTEAAHRLCSSLDADKKYHHMQDSVGHYGIFNGRRWRELIMPRVRHFMRQTDPNAKSISPVPEADYGESKALRAAQWSGKAAPKAKASSAKTKPAAKKTAAKAKAAPKAKAKLAAKPKATAPKKAAPKAKIAPSKTAAKSTAALKTTKAPKAAKGATSVKTETPAKLAQAKTALTAPAATLAPAEIKADVKAKKPKAAAKPNAAKSATKAKAKPAAKKEKATAKKATKAAAKPKKANAKVKTDKKAAPKTDATSTNAPAKKKSQTKPNLKLVSNN